MFAVLTVLFSFTLVIEYDSDVVGMDNNECAEDSSDVGLLCSR